MSEQLTLIFLTTNRPDQSYRSTIKSEDINRCINGNMTQWDWGCCTCCKTTEVATLKSINRSTFKSRCQSLLIWYLISILKLRCCVASNNFGVTPALHTPAAHSKRNTCCFGSFFFFFLHLLSAIKNAIEGKTSALHFWKVSLCSKMNDSQVPPVAYNFSARHQIQFPLIAGLATLRMETIISWAKF